MIIFTTDKVPVVQIFKKYLHPLLGIIIFSLLSSCSNRPDTNNTEKLVTIRLGSETIHVQIAITREELNRGLKHRKSLDPNHGMLFVFPHPDRQAFWMKDTPMNLDLAYFSSDFVLREIHTLRANNRTPVASKSNHIQYALEMNEGFFAEKSIPPGSKLDQETLTQAIHSQK